MTTPTRSFDGLNRPEEPWLDPIAARKREAPLFFARLRPTPIAIAVAGFAARLVGSILR